MMPHRPVPSPDRANQLVLGICVIIIIGTLVWLVVNNPAKGIA